MTRPAGLRPHTKTKPEATRESNRRLLLQGIFDDGPLSRADLARSTGLGRATVSEITADLIGEGLVIEVGRGTSTGGKPPTLVELDPNGRFIIAVDLSARPILAALLNLRGRIVTTVAGKATVPRGRAVLEELHQLVTKLVGAAKMPPLGIGLGVPGTVDDEGVVLASELDWSDLPLREQLEDTYGLPAFVATEAEVAAIAEFGRSSIVPTSTLLYVKAEDRIATGIVTAGTLHRTPAHGGDLTHLAVPDSTRLCRCGRLGCLGAEVSVTKVLGEEARDISTEARRRLAAESPPACRREARLLGSAIAPMVASLDIDLVVVGGQFAEWDSVADDVAAGIEAALGWSSPVTSSPLGQSAVLLGAAGQVLSKELGVVWS